MCGLEPLMCNPCLAFGQEIVKDYHTSRLASHRASCDGYGNQWSDCPNGGLTYSKSCWGMARI